MYLLCSRPLFHFFPNPIHMKNIHIFDLYISFKGTINSVSLFFFSFFFSFSICVRSILQKIVINSPNNYHYASFSTCFLSTAFGRICSGHFLKELVILQNNTPKITREDRISYLYRYNL